MDSTNTKYAFFVFTFLSNLNTGVWPNSTYVSILNHVQICVCIMQAVLLYVQFPWCNESIMYCIFTRWVTSWLCQSSSEDTDIKQPHIFIWSSECAFSQQITFTANLEKMVSIWLFAVHPLTHDEGLRSVISDELRMLIDSLHFCIWQTILTKATSFNIYVKVSVFPVN